jgi:hypothetical protein
MEAPSERPVPSPLHSEYEEQPFSRCTDCRAQLSTVADGFVISKIYKASECIMEYALCSPCQHRLVSNYSEESRARLSAWQRDHFLDLDSLDCCGFCGDPSSGTGEFSIAGMCHGSSLTYAIHVCSGCAGAMLELISTATRESWQRFVDDNFPGVPANFLPEPLPSLV